jgi:hypothetical protein
MKLKAIAVALAATFIATLAPVATAPADATEVICIHRKPKHFYFELPHSRVGAVVAWRFCWDNPTNSDSHRWVRLDRILWVAHETDTGSSEGCDWKDANEGWDIQWSITQPYNQFTMHSMKHHLECSKTTWTPSTGMRMFSLHTWPRMKFLGGRKPVLTARVTERRSWLDPDTTLRDSVRFSKP